MIKTLSLGILTTYAAEAIHGISLISIIEWYGMICLAALPVSLASLIYIYKKRPNVVSAFDRTVDRIVDGRQKGGEPLKEKTEPENGESSASPKAITVEEDNEEAGIPNMILQVGDRYQCCLSKKNRNDILGGDFTWGTDNPFVGDINETKGVFEAKKVGRTYIECGAKQIRIYYAEVRPNLTGWFGYLPVNDVLNKTCLADIKMRELARKILSIDGTKNTITYDWGGMTLSYQMNRKDEVVRILFRIPDRFDLIDTIKKGIAEYMEPLKTRDEIKERFYYYHMCGLDEDYPESVDFTAFIRKSGKDDWYFGIGECWRAGASDGEIKENTEMVERSFKDLLDKQDIPVMVGSKLKKESRSTANGQTETPAQKAVSRRSRKAKTVAEPAWQEKEQEIREPADTGTTTEEISPEPERSNVSQDDPTEIPDTNPSNDGEDYSDGENRIEIQSESDDPFADFSEAGEQEYGHEPANDINHEEQ